MKKIIIAAIMMLITAAQTIESKSQWDNTIVENGGVITLPQPVVNTNSQGDGWNPFASSGGIHIRPYAAPPGSGGDGQKVPVNGGFYILAGLALAYGLVRRNFGKTVNATDCSQD